MRYEPVRHPQTVNTHIGDAFFGEKFQNRAAETTGDGMVFDGDHIGNLLQDLTQKIFVERFHKTSIHHRRVNSQRRQVFRRSQCGQNRVADAENRNVLSRP